MRSLLHLPEPKLLFRYGQALEDPRDGLTLFGPLDEISPYGIRAAVIGTPAGIAKYKTWVSWIQGLVRLFSPNPARPPVSRIRIGFPYPLETGTHPHPDNR